MAEARRGFDKNVYIFIVFLIVIGLLVFLMKCLTSNKCNADFTFAPATIYSNTNVTFTAQGASNNVKWDFGDGTTMDGSPATHTFGRPDSFKVTMHSGDCTREHWVQVLKKAEIVVETYPEPKIEGPDKATVGQPVMFKEVSGNGKSWEWYFQETGGVDGKEQSVKYAFQYAGDKEITVVIDGKGKATHKIKVAAAKNPGSGKAGKTPVEFLAMIKDCQARKKEISDFIGVVCDMGEKIKITEGKGAEEQIFSSYLQQLRSQTDEITVQDVKCDNSNGCITNIRISQKHN